MAYTCSVFFVFFAVSVLLLNEPVAGIRCWQCSSDVDPRCGDPFNHTHFTLTDCDRERTHSPYLQDHGVCRKSVQKVSGEKVIIRSCSWEPENKNVEGPCSPSHTPSYIEVEFCETCGTEACNNAPSFRETIVAMVLPIAMTIVLSRYTSHNL